MWFHRPFRADEWLLYDLQSPNAFGSRGFTLGRIFTRDGQLAVSVAQEGLMRRRTR
jgi:acyl-CoA thioesterase-2